MRSKEKIAEEIVLIRYYNVLYYLFFKTGMDDFKRQCLIKKIEAKRIKQGKANFERTLEILLAAFLK